jgi:hypothetical protein
VRLAWFTLRVEIDLKFWTIAGSEPGAVPFGCLAGSGRVT